MKKYAFVFVVLILWTTPYYVYGIEPVENKASNSKHKAEEKSINNEPNEHKEDRNDIQKDEVKENSIRKTQELQYTQLLEVHRSYFTVFLQVLSIYLAIMGACLKIVSDSIRKMKKDPEDGSKTVLITLILFSFVVSCLFFVGLLDGRVDAIKRKQQIVHVAGILEVEQIGVELLQQVIYTMIIGTVFIMTVWIVMLVRGLMACAEKPTLRGFVTYLIQRR